MLSGRQPFKGPTAADVVGAVLFRDPEPLEQVADVPDGLCRIVATSLRKERNERYQTCAEFLLDLASVARALDIDSQIDRLVTPMPSSSTDRRWREASRCAPRAGGGSSAPSSRLACCRSSTTAATSRSTTSPMG